jgi:hypothetical protein
MTINMFAFMLAVMSIALLMDISAEAPDVTS